MLKRITISMIILVSILFAIPFLFTNGNPFTNEFESILALGTFGTGIFFIFWWYKIVDDCD